MALLYNLLPSFSVVFEIQSAICSVFKSSVAVITLKSLIPPLLNLTRKRVNQCSLGDITPYFVSVLHALPFFASILRGIAWEH